MSCLQYHLHAPLPNSSALQPQRREPLGSTQTSGHLGAPGDLECEPGALASLGLASSE